MVWNCPSYLSQACKGKDKVAEVIIHWFPTTSRVRVGLRVSTTVRHVFQAWIHMGNEDMGGGLYCVVRAVSAPVVVASVPVPAVAESVALPAAVAALMAIPAAVTASVDVPAAVAATVAGLAVVVPVEHGGAVGLEVEPWAV